MGWLIAAGILVLLALLPLGVILRYDEEGARVWVSLGWIPISVYPAKPKEPAPAAEKPKKSSGSGFEKTKTKKKSGGKITDFLPLVEDVLAFLADFKNKLVVKNLELNLVLAGDDPADLAIAYGRAWAAVGNLMPRLEQFLKIRRRDIRVQCDFASEQTQVQAGLHISITLGRLIWVSVFHGTKLLRRFLDILNQRKGGASNHE